MAREDEQRFKDMLKAIEAGEIEEDLELTDPEEYDDMGGIKSLDRGAPSIKLASETGPEEFELELMSVIREFNDRMQSGELDPSTTIDEYINDYLSRKKMMMEDKNRQMAMYGGRMKYAAGDEKPYEMKDGKKKYIDLPEKGYSNPFDAREAGDLEDRARYREIQSVKDKKGKAKPFTMDPEKLKQLIEKAKQEKEKLAKGGIAGVL
jgi:hypothetical protein